jgi:phage terminase large subunit
MELRIDKNIFNDKFFPFLFDYSQRYNIYYGGRGSGKSYFVIDKLVIKALKDKRKVLFIRKTAASLKDSLYTMVLESLEKLKIKQLCIISKSTYTITLPNGSVFLFKGLDDSEKAKGIAGITDIFIDEASDITYEDFNALDKSLRHATAKGQQIYLAFNPVSKQNWVYWYWFKDGNKPDTFYLHSTYKDNRFVPQAFIDSLEYTKTVNPQRYIIEALGEFASLDKLVYPSFAIEDFNPADIKGGKYQFGLDFGFANDEAAFIANVVDEANRKVYIYDEFYEKELTNDKIAALLIYKGYGKAEIYCDNEPKSIVELRRCGIERAKPAIKGSDSVNFGIQRVQQYQIIVSPKCENTIIELQNYSYVKDKSTGEYTNKPIDKFNHLCDALRYSFGDIRGSRLKVMSKSALGL